MEPTNATSIFYAVLAVAALFFVVCCARTKDDSIEMTWTKKRDLARYERSWNK